MLDCTVNLVKGIVCTKTRVCVCVRLFGCEHSQGGKNKLIYYGCSDSIVCIVFPQLKVSVVEFAHCSIRFSFTVELDQELGYNCLLFTG